MARVQGRQSLGSGWVSHVLQELVARLWRSRDTMARLRRAEAAYAERRSSLLQALRDRQIQATGRSGFNVSIGVPEEAAVVAALGARRAGPCAAGERYRLASAPAIRVTAASLTPTDAARFAGDLAAILRPARQMSIALSVSYLSASFWGASGPRLAHSPFTVAPPCMNMPARLRKAAGKFERRLGGLVERRDLRGGELHVERGEVVVELLQRCARR